MNELIKISSWVHDLLTVHDWLTSSELISNHYTLYF